VRPESAEITRGGCSGHLPNLAARRATRLGARQQGAVIAERERLALRLVRQGHAHRDLTQRVADPPGITVGYGEEPRIGVGAKGHHPAVGAQRGARDGARAELAHGPTHRVGAGQLDVGDVDERVRPRGSWSALGPVDRGAADLLGDHCRDTVGTHEQRLRVVGAVRIGEAAHLRLSRPGHDDHRDSRSPSLVVADVAHPQGAVGTPGEILGVVRVDGDDPRLDDRARRRVEPVQLDPAPAVGHRPQALPRDGEPGELSQAGVVDGTLRHGCCRHPRNEADGDGDEQDRQAQVSEPCSDPAVPPSRRAYGNTAAASSAPTRAFSLVPSAVCSSARTSPSACTRPASAPSV